ncbi:MAG: flagellar basal-body rod protein FlgG [Nisaea sp.]|jgi:flagellar basal-body rod protein FlgG|uniref:flagellar basal-body rod protein FlgG n=1 Tax=Nisaea sp. TaxID=2024842 RepID=UPI001B29FDF7|nr:flagellar basal-body rod protein FlgG [Nisaea sp.]MBO6559979.1 flagellar basal-body rod protein FlgG [Nisaea sp.]
MQSLNIASTGMLAQQTNVEVISNNIANMNTTAFKRHRAQFQDLLYQDLRRVGSNSSDAGTIVPSGIQLGVGVRTAATYRVNEQGSLILTDNQFDLAIRGNGYFQVLLPDGETAYTRDGSFQVSQTGELVTADGYTVQPGITIPSEAVGVTINESGQVLVKLDGQTAESNVGQIQLAIFQNDAGLEHAGNNLLLETEASGAPSTANPTTDGFGGLFQGYIESSNVDPVQEITDLITAQRAYELNSKVIETSDQMMATVNQVR